MPTPAPYDLVQDPAAIIGPFAEQIVYRPLGNAANDRAIWTNVLRDPPDVLPEHAGSLTPIAHIDVANRASSAADDDDSSNTGGIGGISAAELDTRKDQIVYAVRVGQTPQARSIGKILSQDAGMLRLEVR